MKSENPLHKRYRMPLWCKGLLLVYLAKFMIYTGLNGLPKNEAESYEMVLSICYFVFWVAIGTVGVVLMVLWLRSAKTKEKIKEFSD